VKLLKGWNVVAAPYPVRCRLDPQALSLVTDEGESTLAAAKEAGLCEDHLWAYDSEKESYFLVGPLSQEEQWLDPWRGYWLNVSRDAVLRWPLVPPASPVETAARPARRQDAPPATFYVYGDDGEGGSRGSVLIGFGARADLRLASPPMSPEQQVSLASVDGKRLLGAHVVAGSPSRVCWQLSVTAPPESRVRLSWPDLSPVPSEYRLLLRDPVTGTRCLMRTCAGFDLALGAEETQRVMVIQAEQRGAGGFLVQSLAVRAGPNTASVSFTLGRPASVTMVVRNIAGRVVKRVVADRLFGSGPASVSFARVSDLGTALPAGVYLVQVTAAGEDGERSSAMSAVRW